MPVTIKGAKISDASYAAWLKFLETGNPAPIADQFGKIAKAAALAVPGDIEAAGKSALNAFGALASEFSTIIEDDLSGLGHILPGQQTAAFKKTMSDAFGFGVAAHLAALTAEFIEPLKFLGVPQVAALLAQFAGFEELIKAYHGPILEHAIEIPSNAQNAATFRSTPPAGRTAAEWAARGLLGNADLENAIGWSGLIPAYEAAEKAAAYRPVQPRAMSTLYQDAPFPFLDVQDMLTFGGYRPQDQQRLLLALQNASIKNVRQQYEASIVQAWERGDITDAEAIDDLQQLNYSQQAIGYIQLAVANRKLVQLSELYRKSIDTAYKYGLITDADYVPQLEAIGIAQADAEAHYQLASFTKQGKALAAEERAATAAAKALSRVAVAAAIANFQTGAVDTAALTAALLAAGMVPAAVPFAVAIQTAKQAGRQRLVYGKLMTPTAAKNLQLQVGAVTEQVYKKVITPDAGFAQIQAYGVDAANALQLVAKAAAEAGILWPAPFPRIPPIGTP